jgi:hypothetical protein
MFDNKIVLWAEKFWSLAGKYEPFPRSLEAPISWALPLAIVKLPHLGLKEICQWLRERDIFVKFGMSSRSLRACLVARSGRGVIFLDGCDSSNEQRLSLAHEVSHFLKDYLHPREKVLSCFGETIKDVLDGVRQPTPEERLKGIFNGVSIGTYTDLMERSNIGDIRRMHILDAEDFADQLALELLAPHLMVIRRMDAQGIKWKDDSAFNACLRVLIDDFGLPRDVANKYANMLIMVGRQPKSFRDWIGVKSA